VSALTRSFTLSAVTSYPSSGRRPRLGSLAGGRKMRVTVLRRDFRFSWAMIPTDSE
jgi:hypothetical protein